MGGNGGDRMQREWRFPFPSVKIICHEKCFWSFKKKKKKFSVFFCHFSVILCHRPEQKSDTVDFQLSWLCCYGRFFVERFNCSLPVSPDQVSTVPPLNVPQAQLPGKAFMIKCETRAILPRESRRRGCWLRTTTVWNFLAVCHTHREKWKQM